MVGVVARRSAARLCAVSVIAMMLLPLAASSALATGTECPPYERAETATALDVSYYVNGTKVDGLAGKVSQGDTVRVDVVVPEGCAVELTLAAYESPVPKFHEDQVLFDYETGTYQGTDSLEVTVPGCYFQVDFAYGGVIESFKGGVRYGKRLIAAAVGGLNPCQPHESPSPSPSPSHSPSPSPSMSASPSPSASPSHSPSPSPSMSASPSPSPSLPAESPAPSEEESPAPSPAPSPTPPAGGAQPEAPRSALASTGVPVLILAILALAGIGTGSTLLHTTRRRRAD